MNKLSPVGKEGLAVRETKANTFYWDNQKPAMSVSFCRWSKAPQPEETSEERVCLAYILKGGVHNGGGSTAAGGQVGDWEITSHSYTVIRVSALEVEQDCEATKHIPNDYSLQKAALPKGFIALLIGATNSGTIVLTPNTMENIFYLNCYPD